MRERRDGREGGKNFSIVYLFANQVRNTLEQNMEGDEDSRGGNSSRLCARYLSSSLSPPCSLSYSPIAIYTQVFRRRLGLRHSKAQRHQQEVKEEMSPKGEKPKKSRSSKKVGGMLHRSTKLPMITTPLRLLISLHTGVDGGGWHHTSIKLRTVSTIEGKSHPQYLITSYSSSSSSSCYLTLVSSLFSSPLLSSTPSTTFIFDQSTTLIDELPLMSFAGDHVRGEYPYNTIQCPSTMHSKLPARLSDLQR